MPSALQASRDILANGVARVRSGLNAYDRNLSEPGPEIPVAPFDAQNVSTPAALVKLGTSIAAARRQRANYDAARKSASDELALESEKTRAEIGKLRAQTEAELRPPAAPRTTDGSAIIRQGPYKDMTVDEARIEIARVRATTAGAPKPPSEGSIRGRLAAQARAETMRAPAEGVRQSGTYNKLFELAESPDDRVSNAALTALGIDPTLGYGDKVAAEGKAAGWYGPKRKAALDAAREKITAATKERVRAEAANRAADILISGGVGEGGGEADTGDIVEVDEWGNPIE